MLSKGRFYRYKVQDYRQYIEKGMILIYLWIGGGY